MIKDETYTEFIGVPGNAGGLFDREIIKTCVLLFFQLVKSSASPSDSLLLLEEEIILFKGCDDTTAMEELVELFKSNDNHMILFLSASLDIATTFDKISNASRSRMIAILNPVISFSRFINVDGDLDDAVSLLLDMLISNIEFLKYFSRLLRCGARFPSDVCRVMEELKGRLVGLHDRGLFPYDPSSLVMRLDKVLN
jgi:hypothetical protein